MRFQAGGIAIAFVAIAGVPAVIGQATQSPPAATPVVAPKEASLTVPLNEAEKIDSDTARLAGKATGAPPSGTTDLLAADGRRVVAASELDAKECEGLPTLQAVGTEADDTWCIGLDGIPDGSQVTGKLGGAKTTLALTVARRPSFWASPLAIVVGGILVGLLAVSIPVGLRRGIRRRLLARAEKVNRGRGARRSSAWMNG